MDTRDGKIYSPEELDRGRREGWVTIQDMRYMEQLKHDPTPEQRARRKVGRNHACPCGSGKKFKKCCLFKVQRP